LFIQFAPVKLNRRGQISGCRNLAGDELQILASDRIRVAFQVDWNGFENACDLATDASEHNLEQPDGHEFAA